MTDLAVLMACGIDSDRWPNDGCVAWINSRDTWCRRPTTTDRLCARHRSPPTRTRPARPRRTRPIHLTAPGRSFSFQRKETP